MSQWVCDYCSMGMDMMQTDFKTILVIDGFQDPSWIQRNVEHQYFVYSSCCWDVYFYWQPTLPCANIDNLTSDKDTRITNHHWAKVQHPECLWTVLEMTLQVFVTGSPVGSVAASPRPQAGLGPQEPGWDQSWDRDHLQGRYRGDLLLVVRIPSRQGSIY